MLAYERLQTIIGREIMANELLMVAMLLNKDIESFYNEESVEPWEDVSNE